MGSSEVWYGVVTSASSREEPRIRVSDHPSLRGISPDWVATIGDGSVDTTYSAGELIAREGEFANRFHLVFHGAVAIEVDADPNGPRVVQVLGPGEVIDWSAICPPYVWSFDARARKETRVVSLDTMVLRRALESRPVEGYQFLKRLLPVVGSRLERARRQLSTLPTR